MVVGGGPFLTSSPCFPTNNAKRIRDSTFHPPSDLKQYGNRDGIFFVQNKVSINQHFPGERRYGHKTYKQKEK